MRPIPTRLYLSLCLLILLVACGGAGKPTIKLSASATTLEEGEELTLSADAKGAQKVEFFKGTDKVGEDSSAPYELKLPLTSDTDATLSFTAKAIAASGQSAVSQGVSVSVKIDKEAPKISLSASNSNLSAAGAVTLTADATDNKGVVKVEFLKGTEKLGEDTTPADGFSLVVNLGAEHNGSLKYIAKAYDKKGNVGTSAEVTVSVDIDEVAPTISLNSDKTSITIDGSATLTADASDNKGVTKVEFFKGQDKIGEDTEAPFTHSLNFTADNNGTHTYSAKAYDAKDNSTTSNTVPITVDIDAINPEVNLVSDLDKSTLTEAGPATLNATASDNKSVVKVEFYEGSNKIGEDTEAPFVHPLSFTASNNGPHTYTAKAFDSSNNIATSNTITITVDIDATNPEVGLAVDKTTLTKAGPVTLTATASDNGGVVKVEFYKGLNKIGEDTETPYIHLLSFDASNNGSHTYTAKAFDAKGNVGTSAEASITVDIDIVPPTISLGLNKTNLTQSGPALLTATVSDNKGVARVEFYKGNTKLAEDLEAPFTQEVTFNATHNGDHTYTAKAFDTSGNSTPSGPVTITVDIDITEPSVTLSASPTSLNAKGQITLSANASDNKGVVKVEFFRNDSKIAEDTNGENNVFTHQLSYDNSYKATDSFSAKAYDADGNMAISNTAGVEIHIDIDPPTVSLTAPPTKLTAPGTVTLTATNSDNFGVSKLEFYRVKTTGDELLSPVISNPTPSREFPVMLGAQDNGAVKFYVKAYDAKGNFTTSAPQTEVEVEIKPTITLFIIPKGSSSDVSDAGGSLNLVWAGEHIQSYALEASPGATPSINAGGNYQGQVVVPPNLTAQDKTYTVTLRAKAFGSGIPDDVKTLNITVAKDTTLPTVSLNTDATTITAAGSVKLTATASDPAGIQKVEFYKSGDSTPIFSDTSSPYEYTPPTFTAADNGIHTYTARAYDINNNSKDSAELSVSVDIRGSLTVTIGGLPVEASGDVLVSGPNNFSQIIGNTTTLDNLKPGNYILTPRAVNSGYFSYISTASTVAVVGGSTASGSVTYAANTGALIVNFLNPPGGTSGSVSITGPNNFSQVITNPIIIGRLIPGNYTIAPANVDSGNYSYGAPAFTVTVTSETLANGNFTYALNTGALTVTITNLPAGQNVTVSGPGYSQTLNTSTTLARLVPGDYAISAPDVPGYTKTISGSPASVANGTTATASVVYVLVPPGSLDTTFGTGGIVTTAIGPRHDFANAVTTQTDGKLVVAGSAHNGSDYDFALVRYNPDGSLDPTFGTGGRVTTAIGAFDERAYAVAIQSDGKIVVAGTGKNGTDSDYDLSDFALVRYNTDGTLDSSFGVGGKVLTDFSSSKDIATAIALDSNGKIVLAGYSDKGGDETQDYTDDFALARYNTNGSLDSGFGTGGKVTTDFPSTNPQFPSNFDRANAIAIQSDGKIVAAGISAWSEADFALVRYNTDGSLDTSFGTGGKVITDFDLGWDQATGVALQSNGQIVVGGYSNNNGYDFALARYNSTGSLDTSFGTGGKVITDFGTNQDELTSIAIQSDGKIVAAGHIDLPTTWIDFALARYNSNGSLDTSFGTGGKATTDFSLSLEEPSNDTITAITIQPDGKIVAVGYCNPAVDPFDFCLVRYNP